MGVLVGSLGTIRPATLPDGTVVKPRGKPTLAPETDCRKPIGDFSDDFENIA
jgi:hypothetical protein